MHRSFNMFAGLLFFVGSIITYAADAEEPISRVLFGSCIKQDRPISIFHTMASQRPDLLLFTGDNIYADTDDMNVMREKYAALASRREFQALQKLCPILATWDDHDYGVNDGGADFPKRAESQKEFLDFWQVPLDSPRRDQAGIYDAHLLGPEGKRLQIIMLDTRYVRSPLKKGERRVGGPYYPDDDPSKTMLGETQWQWLKQQLKQPAEIRVIVSSIQFAASAAGQECWANLPREQQRMTELIADTNAGGVIVISGDRHWSELSAITEGVPYPIYDWTCSSFNQSHPRGTPTENSFRIDETTFHHENYGVMAIDWEAADPLIAISVRDIEGRSRIEKQINLSELNP